MALADYAREKLVVNEMLVLGEEIVLNFEPAGGLEIVQTHKAHAGAIDVERPELEVAHTNKLKASVGERNEFLPLLLGSPLFRDVDAGADEAGKNAAGCKAWNTVVQYPSELSVCPAQAILDPEA